MATVTPQVVSPQPPTTGTPQVIIDAYARAHERAVNLQMVAYRNPDGSFAVPSATSELEHTVTRTGRRWYDLSCTCRGGASLACTHRALVVHAVKYGLWPLRGTARVATPHPAPTTRAAADRQAYRRTVEDTDLPFPRSLERDARHTADVRALVAAGKCPLAEAYE